MPVEELTLSLEESLKLTNPMFQEGIIQTVGLDMRLFASIPFKKVVGNSYIWNTEDKLADTEFREVGENIAANKTTVTSHSQALKILGEEVKVDTYEKDALSNNNDIYGIQAALKLKAIIHKYQHTFLMGNNTVNPLEFDGLAKSVTSRQTVAATSDIITDMDALYDLISGDPSIFIMSQSTRRLLHSQAKEYITFSREDFGQPLTHYGETPIIDIADNLLEFGTIYAVKFDVNDGVVGLHNGGIKLTDIGEMETQPAYLARLEFFCGLAVLNEKALAVRKLKV